MMGARLPSSPTSEQLRLLPIIELRSGRTVCLELLDGDALDEAAVCAEAWQRVWPDVLLLVPLPAIDAVSLVRAALDRSHLDAGALAVEVPVRSLPEATAAVEALGVGLVVGSLEPELGAIRRLSCAGAAMVKVPASTPDLGPAVAAAHLVTSRVVITGVRSIVGVGDAGQAGADAAQGTYLGGPLVGLDAVLGDLAEEAAVEEGDPVGQRFAELEARAVQVEALVDELSAAGDRGPGRAAPRSGRSGPRVA